MKKYLALALSVILMLGVLTACGGKQDGKSSDNGDGPQVGIVLPTKDEPRWLQDEAAFKTALEDAGFTSEVVFSQGSTATELSNVEDLVDKNIKVLVLCAQDASAAGAAVQAAKEGGVKVVCYDRLITNTDAVDYYASFDSFSVGEAQGKYLIDKYAGKKDVPLYLYGGPVADNNSFMFFAGAWSVLNKAVADGQFVVENCDAVADYKGKELNAKDRDAMTVILETINTDWDVGKAKALAEANLKARKATAKGDVAILAPNDGTARAIADAFAADKDVKSYVITGQDAELASLKYIQTGKQSMTVWKNTATLAKVTCDMVTEILEGTSPKTDMDFDNGVKMIPTVLADIVVIDRDNLPKLINEGSFSQDDIDNAE